MGKHLPDPLVVDEVEVCPRCGYSLAGLRCPAPCPECGVEIPGLLLVLHGVPRGIAGAKTHRVALAILMVFSVYLGLQTFPFVLFRFGLIGVLFLVLTLVSIGFFAVTLLRGNRSGAGRFTFLPSCIAVEDVQRRTTGDERTRSMIALQGGERFRVDRVSRFWRRLTVVDSGRKPIFVLGFRCPDSMEHRVVVALAHALKRPLPPGFADEPTAADLPLTSMNLTRATTTTRHDSHA